MTTFHTAHGLASLGRHGDTMLVHMSPHEVAGLNYLAKKQGTHLTVNPHTGLPEAFSLGGFFSSLLPMFAGALTGGAGMPLWAGIAAGAATGAATNKDHLMGALTGGLGGYGGFGLGNGLAAAGATPGAAPIVEAGGYVPGTVEGANTGLNTAGASMMNNPATYNTANLNNIANTSGFTGSAGSGASGVDKSFLGGMDRLGPGANQMGTGIKNIATNQPGAWDAFKGSFVEPGAKPISDLAAYGKIAMPIGGAALGGLEPSDIYGNPIKPSEKGKYDPNATLNLSGDTGLRLYAVGGAVGNPMVGGGISDLYNRPEGQTTETISQDGYGIGRLDSLANAESMNTAKTLGYAMGGPVSFADGGSTNPLTGEIQPLDQAAGITSLAPQPTTSQTMPTQQVQNTATNLDNQNGQGSIISQVTANLKADPNYQGKNPIEVAIVKQLKGSDPMQQGQPTQQGLGSIAPSQPMAPSFSPSQAMAPTYYAGMNAPRGYADGGDVSMNLDRLPSLNLNLAGAPTVIPNTTQTNRNSPFGSMMGSAITSTNNNPFGFVTSNTGNSGGPFMNMMGLGNRNAMRSAPSTPKSYALNLNSGKQEAQYAHGGYLDGQGDGMSDSIPATIEGKQPARLADGEFVVPADVVSHIGNGSSKAGSQRLYSMLDKIRKARTGTKKQGKQIKPEKYMPA